MSYQAQYTKDNWHHEAATVAIRNSIRSRRWGMRVTVYSATNPADNGEYVLSYNLANTNRQSNSNWLKVAEPGAVWGGGGGGPTAGSGTNVIGTAVNIGGALTDDAVITDDGTHVFNVIDVLSSQIEASVDGGTNYARVNIDSDPGMITLSSVDGDNSINTVLLLETDQFTSTVTGSDSSVAIVSSNLTLGFQVVNLSGATGQVQTLMLGAGASPTFSLELQGTTGEFAQINGTQNHYEFDIGDPGGLNQELITDFSPSGVNSRLVGTSNATIIDQTINALRLIYADDTNDPPVSYNRISAELGGLSFECNTGSYSRLSFAGGFINVQGGVSGDDGTTIGIITSGVVTGTGANNILVGAGDGQASGINGGSVTIESGDTVDAESGSITILSHSHEGLAGGEVSISNSVLTLRTSEQSQLIVESNSLLFVLSELATNNSFRFTVDTGANAGNISMSGVGGTEYTFIINASGSGDNVSIRAGAGAGGDDGGDIELIPGAAPGAGHDGYLLIRNLPINNIGLPSGAVYANANVLTIVP